MLGVFSAREVVAAEVGVGTALGEDVVGADEDRVGNGDDCLRAGYASQPGSAAPP